MSWADFTWLPKGGRRKHPFLAAGAKQIGEIRMTVRKLKYGQLSRVTRNVVPEKARELAHIKLFALADGTGFFVSR